MDLFSGNGGVSRAIHSMGFKSKFWDIKHGSAHDLTDNSVIDRIIREIRKGKVLACMMAPVCTSFSVARDRTQVIRSRRFPWGIPSRFLSEKEIADIRLGNACFRSCFRILQALDEHRVPYILENPDTSKAWYLPQMRRQLALPWAKYIRSDFCCFGTPWRKRTGFLCGHVPCEDLTRLSKVCSSVNHTCDLTGKKHVRLTGNRHGIPLTKWAEPYPQRLCTALAFALTAQQHTSLASRFQ
ncbi:unnamed protein product [Symbiodinium sp. CCMP2456]|nr:unnamed protein product [Symbiodinium sp. CCMP2456]